MCKFFRWLFGRKKPLSTYEGDIVSPNGRITCKVKLLDGRVCYSVIKDNKIVVRDSYLGMDLRGDYPLKNNLMLVRTMNKTMDETWETKWGEEKFIRNNYHETALYLSENSGKKRLFTMRFRVFDEGVAFRYEIPPQPEFQRLVVADELTEFNVDINGYAWHIPAYQPDRYEYNYAKSPVYELTSSVHTPLTIETPTGSVLSIHEAALYNYGSATIRLNRNNVLATDITPLSDGAKAYVELPFNTPWRVIMIADNALDLTTNRMILNLNDPPREEFDWVRPIKFLGIWWAMFVGEWTWAEGERHGATTKHAKEYIDACNRLGIDGLLIEGWNNGWNGDWLKNGPTNDFLHPVEGFNLEKVADYAREHNVSLIGHHETVGYVDNYERQLEEAYKYYAENGICYVKPGYAGSWMIIQGRKEYHHSQIGVRHYQKALELAAKYKIMLDVHEPIKGTGLERTWPNLLSREGARGQEYEGGALSPSHTTILPFTRLLAGGMDYTSGIFDVTNGTKRIATTLTRQLAYYVTIFSGMQMAADRPKFYEGEFSDAFQFIRDVPVSWEKTVPILGQIGQYYIVARQERNSDDWYVGGVTNEEGHRVRLNLDFLGDYAYEARIYRDGDDAHYRENQLSYVVESRKVNKMDYLDIWMAPGGGFAVSLKRI